MRPSWRGPRAALSEAWQHSKVGYAHGRGRMTAAPGARTMIGDRNECVQCRGVLPAGAKFCPSCGTPVATRAGAGTGASAGTGTVATPTLPAGERRQVAVLFADLAGYTRLSSGLDAEEVHKILTRYFELA